MKIDEVRSSKFLDHGGHFLDNLLPIGSRLVESLQDVLDNTQLLVVSVDLLQLINSFLCIVHVSADLLVVFSHVCMHLDNVDVVVHKEFAAVKLILGSVRGKVDRIFELREVLVQAFAQVGKGDPRRHVMLDLSLFILQSCEIFV